MHGGPIVLVLFLTAALGGFGGIYAWALAPIAVTSVSLAWLARRERSPRLGPSASHSSDTRSLDLAILSFIGAIAVQLVPLPASIRTLLSPHGHDIASRLRPDAALLTTAAGPLSVDASATWQALTLTAAVALTYVAARTLFSVGGVRLVCRGLLIVGAIFAIEAIVQRALSPTLIYGVWQPRDAGALPFGPVVNRNHFAGWLLMTAAVTAGYLIARISRRERRARRHPFRRAALAVAESSAGGTALLWPVITLAIFAAQSRSAVIGLAVAIIFLTRAVTGGWRTVAAVIVAAVAIIVVLLVAGESSTTQLVDRFAGTLDARDVSRVVIWRETLPMMMDFGVTGVGAGAYGRAMITYQQTSPFAAHLGAPWYFNHAHNHYLQLATEGGLLLLLPFAVVVIAFIRLARNRLREDAGKLRTVRLGAAAGLAGIATQSVWEVPLTMPAAALLAATLAALLTYRRDPSGRAVTGRTTSTSGTAGDGRADERGVRG